MIEYWDSEKEAVMQVYYRKEKRKSTNKKLVTNDQKDETLMTVDSCTEQS
jgi:hypothetical protein